MAEYILIDAFPAFLDFWGSAKDRPLDAQIEGWAAEYMAAWPELLDKQQADYAEQDADWRDVARERVFPFLAQRLAAMTAAHDALLTCTGPAYEQARRVLGLDFDVVFVLYVGIGCGAGWATTYAGKPACLYGLENAAECGWTTQETLGAMTAHELGHLLHFRWRERGGLPLGKGPFWQLYEEGFAQRAEHIVMGRDTWHQEASQAQWADWCAANLGWLAAEFLRDADEGKPGNRFFGSWFDIQGWRQCGYFLGHEVVRGWEQEKAFRKIALLPLDEMERRVRGTLAQIAKSAGFG